MSLIKKFRDDPQANPLKTPSGKIEIYSSRLAKIANTWELQKDEVISPLPVYASTFEGWDDPKRSAFPLQLFGFHYKSRTHSSYGNIDVLQASCRQEVWINPVDAQKRGIANGGMLLGQVWGLWLPGSDEIAILLGLTGMATLLAATTHAPIMSTLMVCEMTGEYRLLPGLLIACVLASVLSRTLRHDSIYRQHAAEH